MLPAIHIGCQLCLTNSNCPGSSEEAKGVEGWSRGLRAEVGLSWPAEKIRFPSFPRWWTFPGENRANPRG